MKKFIEKAKYVLTGEEGVSNIEIIVWISVVLVIATALFLFKDSVVSFINRARGVVNNLAVG